MISLGGGMPNPSTFPISSLSMTLRNHQTPLSLSPSELSEGLQYSASFGLPGLVQWTHDWQAKAHQPADDGFGVCYFNGSQHALSVAFDILLNEGDSILVENPTYSGALALLRTLGIRTIPLETDRHGLVPRSLRSALQQHPSARLLYVIPTGQNPSGASLPLERKRELLDLASEHNLLVLEDDPYWNLQLDSEFAAQNRSLFSLDQERRVLRFDSFSKVISAGLRLGFASGPAQLIEKMQLHQQASTLHPSGVSQALLLQILREYGDQGLHSHIDSVQAFYRAQRDHMIAAIERHLTGLVRYSVPQAGMFMWVESVHHRDTHQLIKEGGPQKKVLAVSGQSFVPDDTPSSFIRLSFSTATPEEMDLACSRLAELVKP